MKKYIHKKSKIRALGLYGNHELAYKWQTLSIKSVTPTSNKMFTSFKY